MLWTLAVVLFLLWLVGMVSSYTLGGLIHLFVALALVAVIVQVAHSRRTV